MSVITIIQQFFKSWIEITSLFFLVSLLVGFLKHLLHQETYDKTLGRKGILGSLSGAVLGVLTPVCSCSVAGLYGGLLSQGASLQGSAAFLFAAPAVNEFALALMLNVAGVQGALVYLVLGLISATITGYFSPKIGLIPLRGIQIKPTGHRHSHSIYEAAKESFIDTLKSFRNLFFPITLGVAFTQILIDYLPSFSSLITKLGTAWYGPILASLIGLPSHIEAASASSLLLPIIKSGLPLGTSISLLMSVTISSISEVIILRKIIGDRGVIKLIAWYFLYTSTLGIILNFIFQK